ncbi:MAG: hypothetical protein KAT47_02865 [Candidatus Aegiribacteria sp.]|nr:hypothetical protein [Candidatus Aegiribacteria sp.]
MFSSVVLAIGLEPTEFSLMQPADDGWFNPEFSGWAGFSLISGGGKTLGSGTYVGSMLFSLHPNVTASVDIGYSRLYDFHGFSSGRVLGAIDLQWKASDNFLIQLRCSGSLPDSSLTGF